MWVQLALLFVAMYYCIERFFFFHKARVNAADLLLGLSNHIQKKAYADALHEVARAPGPVARVIHTILMRHHMPRTDLRDIAQEAGQLEVPRIETNMRAILAIALIAPLVGLLGTVLGLAQMFMKVHQANGYAEPAMLSEGIFKSLVTTAIGLAIAVPTYLCYLYFIGRAKRMLHRIERGGIETINMIVDARGDETIVAFQEKRRGSVSEVK